MRVALCAADDAKAACQLALKCASLEALPFWCLKWLPFKHLTPSQTSARPSQILTAWDHADRGGLPLSEQHGRRWAAAAGR